MSKSGRRLGESLAQGGDPGFADDCVPLASAQSTAELETANWMRRLTLPPIWPELLSVAQGR